MGTRYRESSGVGVGVGVVGGGLWLFCSHCFLSVCCVVLLFFLFLGQDGNVTQNTTKAFELFLRAASVVGTDGDSLYNTGHCYWEVRPVFCPLL